MTSPTQVEASLAEVETFLAEVGMALTAAKSEDLQQASTQLRNAAVRFSQVLENYPVQALTPAVAVRVRTVAARLTSQRDALARFTAAVDRQVATVLPGQAPSATYGPGTATQKAGAARMYKAAN